jgi:hypothetical protein
MNRRLAGALVVALGLGAQQAAAALQAVRLTFVGQAAPGIPGAVFERFDQIPTIDRNGVITFRAFLRHETGIVSDGNDEGIWSGTAGNFSLLARENGLVPSGTPGAPEGSRFEAPFSITNFHGHGFSFRGGFGAAQYLVTAAGLSRVAYGGMNVGGDPGDPLLFSGVNGGIAVNATGQYAFGGGFQLGSGGVTTSNRSGLWVNLDGNLRLIARQGSQADGLPAGTTYSSDFGFPEISDSGEVFFKALLSNGNYGIFSFDGVSTKPVALKNDQVPGAPAGTVFGTAAISQPRINSGGDLVIVGSNNLFVKDDSGYRQVPPAGRVGVLTPADITDDGTVVFHRNLSSGSTIFRWLPDGTLQTVATSAFYGSLFAPTISSAGHIAFIAGDAGLFVTEPGGLPVGMTGGPLGGAFIASRMFTDVEYSQFSAAGDLVFTSNTTAHEIYMVRVPEPATVLLFAAAVAVLSRRCRRRGHEHA